MIVVASQHFDGGVGTQVNRWQLVVVAVYVVDADSTGGNQTIEGIVVAMQIFQIDKIADIQACQSVVGAIEFCQGKEVFNSLQRENSHVGDIDFRNSF